MDQPVSSDLLCEGPRSHAMGMKPWDIELEKMKHYTSRPLHQSSFLQGASFCSISRLGLEMRRVTL